MLEVSIGIFKVQKRQKFLPVGTAQSVTQITGDVSWLPLLPSFFPRASEMFGLSIGLGKQARGH